MVADLWNRYEKIDVLPDGGMGGLVKARDRQTGETVLVKMPRTDSEGKEQFTSRFSRECRIMREITHPSIVKMLESLDTSSGPALVLEFVEGRTLRDMLNEKLSAGAAFSVEEFLPIASQIVDAVAYLHTFPRVVHRDLKPENIIIDETGRVKICDFGIALALNDTRITETDIKVGTRPYMAPERYDRSAADASPAVDVFSLGVLFFEMLTGEFLARCPERRLAEHDVPGEISAVIVRCAEADRELRYADGVQLKLAMEEIFSIQAGMDISGNQADRDAAQAAPEDLQASSYPPRRRTPLRYLALAAMVVLVFAGLLTWVFARPEPVEVNTVELIPDRTIEETTVAGADGSETGDILAPTGLTDGYSKREEPGVRSARTARQRAEAPSKVEDRGVPASGNGAKKQENSDTARTAGPYTRKQPTHKNLQRTATPVGGKLFASSKAESTERILSQRAPAVKVLAGSQFGDALLGSSRSITRTKPPTENYLALASQSYSAGDLKSVEAALRKEIALNPEDSGPRLLLGWLLVETGKADAALELWQGGLAENPDDAYLAGAIGYVKGHK